jgi:hypothetical protein
MRLLLSDRLADLLAVGCQTPSPPYSNWAAWPSGKRSDTVGEVWVGSSYEHAKLI